jgi:HlyD family secretion protein
MKSIDPMFDDERYARGPDGESAGPQGAALILELQRLRQAFEHENQQATPPRRAARTGPRPAPRHPAPPKRPRKGKMGRVLDAWLGPLGFLGDNPGAGHGDHRREASMHRAGPDVREPTFARQFQARGPIIAPNDPSLLYMPKPASAVTGTEPERDSLRIGAFGLAPASLPVAATAAPPLWPAERWRQRVSAGVGFLVNRDVLVDIVPGESITQRAGRAFERELRTGLRVLLVVGGLAGGWMVLVPLAGAVVVPGNLVVQSNVKTIQHPTGGVVAQIPVRNGMRVNAGDLLLRLDATQAQASLQVVSKQLDEARAKIARLVAERDGLPRPPAPVEMAARLDDGAIKTLLASEASLFRARVSARESQKELLRSKVSQLGEEIGGLEAQVASKAKQLDLITGELSGVQELFDKRLVPLARLTTLQRESARIEGERGQLTSTIAETRAKIGEAQLQIVRIDQDARTEIVKDLGEAQAREAELSERSVAALDVLTRIEMRAPNSGVVHQLSAHTIGGVIRAGDAIMEVVPDSDDLQIEARLQPNDIDQVRTGQQAFVRFSAFNQRTTPQLLGQVSYVSPDTSRDQQTNMSYFTVRITLPEEERRRLAGLQLSSGMPAEIFMQTGSRTMLSYLFKPILDQFQRAFVER